jgi:hypothetical protein
LRNRLVKMLLNLSEELSTSIQKIGGSFSGVFMPDKFTQRHLLRRRARVSGI